MRKISGWVAIAALAAAVWGCGKADEQFRTLLDPVVARITDRAAAAAGLTGKAPASVVEQTQAIQADLAGLQADVRGLPAEGEKQGGLVTAAQAYLSATQRFVTAQQEFARACGRLDGARVKVRESLDAKVRTSKFSMDFWKESHDRLVLELDNVRKEAEKAKAQLATATTSIQQSADAAGSLLGRDKLIPAATLDAHRKALDAVPLEKGA